MLVRVVYRVADSLNSLHREAVANLLSLLEEGFAMTRIGSECVEEHGSFSAPWESGPNLVAYQKADG